MNEFEYLPHRKRLRPVAEIDRQREAERRARVERLLSGKLREHVKPASELEFDYDEATEIARRSREKAQQAQ